MPIADDLSITRLDDLSVGGFAAMLAESEASGYRFLRRVVVEWESGANRFSRRGEALLVAEKNAQWVGVCGLNIDPYLDDPRVGRVRNVYVLAACRRTGIGRRLVEDAVARARGKFDILRLRAEEMRAARLYESLGFRACIEVTSCTHVLELKL
jgi:GNAT superfamily N-acetyltransferase